MLKPYLEGSWYTLGTDDDALEWFLDLSEQTGKLANLQLHLSGTGVKVIHHTVIKHEAAYALL